MRYAALFFLPFLLCGQQPQAQLSHDCAADGFVVNEVTGEPVPRAVVMIAGTGVSDVTADSVGRWKATGIGCGRLNIGASKAGYLSSVQVRIRSSVVTVSPDSPAHDVKVLMTPQAVASGKVIDENGDPVQNVSVVLMTSRVVEGRRVFQQGGTSVTNDLGEYRLSGLAAGKVIFCARPLSDMLLLPTPGSMILAEKCYPGPPEGGAASAMTLAAGRDVRVDFALQRVPSVHIRGKVTGAAQGRGVMVSIQPRTQVRNGATTRQAQMGRDGSFDVAGVAPGPWLLGVDYWESGSRLFARVPVDVGTSDLEGVMVQVEPGFAVTGTIRLQSGSKPLPEGLKTQVSLQGLDGSFGTNPVALNNGLNSFTVRDIPGGTYRLSLFVPPPFYLKSAMLGGRDIAREPAPILQESGVIDVVIADDSGSVEGRLEDANGDGLTGWVQAMQEGRQVASVAAGSDGKFRMSLPPGEYQLYGWDDIQQVEWADADWMRRHAGSAVSIAIGPGQAVQAKVTRVAAPAQ